MVQAVKSTTIIAIMVLICHALPMECAVVKRVGSNPWRMAVLRIGAAFLAAFYGGLLTEKQRTQKMTSVLAVVFSVIVAVIGILTWSSPVSLLFIIAMVLNTVALSIPEPNTVRIFIMISAPFACAYDILTRSIGGTVNETVSFLSALTAYLRCRRLQSR